MTDIIESPELVATKKKYVAMVRTPEGASQLKNEPEIIRTMTASLPHEERAGFKAFMIEETIKLIKDMQVYGINPATDSEALQNAKRVFLDDIDSNNKGPKLDIDGKDALFASLDDKDKATFIQHVLMTGIKAKLSGSFV